LTAWQCIRHNPKIGLWILWANSKTPFHHLWGDMES
jgi:hypothetical protein